GSIRRECLDHVIVLSEKHLRQILKSYFEYYHRSRTHLSLAKDAPEPRAKQPPESGTVSESAEVGGLHHRYERRAAVRRYWKCRLDWVLAKDTRSRSCAHTAVLRSCTGCWRSPRA